MELIVNSSSLWQHLNNKGAIVKLTNLNYGYKINFVIYLSIFVECFIYGTSFFYV